MTEILKTKSVLMLTLLLLAPMLLLITPVAYASSPTISLTATSGPGDANTAGIGITGTGFPQLKSATGIALYFISTSKTLSVSGATQVSMYGQSLKLGGVSSGTATLDGNGNFQAYFDSPDLPGDTYNVFVTYTPSGGSLTMSPAVTFQITPYLDVRLANDLGTAAISPTTRSAHFGQWVRIRLYSFGASEQVSITGLPIAGGGSVSTSTNAQGDVPTASAVFVRLGGETTGGSKTFTAVGSSTGLTSTRTFTINPSIALFPNQHGFTQVSLPAAAPATIFVALHGFANAETISSATVGGQSASFGAVTTNSDGSFGVGGGGHLSLLYTASLPFGPTSIVLTGSKTGSVTFNAANGNVFNPFGAIGTTTPSGGTLSLLHVPIISSNSQTTGTSIIGFSETSGFVGDTLALYLSGWDGTTPETLTVATAVTFDGTAQTATCGGQAAGTVTVDANGVALCTIAVPASLRGSHTVKVTGSTAAPTNPGTTFSVTPQLLFATNDNTDDAAGMVAFTNSCASIPTSAAVANYGCVMVQGSGFGATSSTTESLSLSIGSTVVNAAFVTPSASGATPGSFSQAIIQSTGLPDLAAGSFTVTASGATAGDNATGYDLYNWNNGATVTSLVVVPNFGLSNSLSVTSVTAGSAVVIQTTTTAGVHGLKPSSSYTVRLDGPAGTQLTTFTSTSGGAVPAGTQFVMPAATSGIHMVDFVQNGASVVIGQTVNVQEDLALDESTYGNLYVSLTGTIAVTPSAGNVGSHVALSGTGLAASTKYNVQLAANGIAYASFTTTSGGAIPAGVNFTFPAIGSTTETGTSETIQLLNTATNVVDSTGTFLLQAAMTIAPGTAAPGTSVKASASGLVASTGYNIVWNAGLNSNGLTTGTIIGAFTSGADGTGSANFTIPSSAQSGSYSVSLLRTTDTLGGSSVSFRLVTAATETVTVGGQNLQGTQTFTPGTPVQTTISGQPAIQVTYTNNVNSAVLGVVYAVVHNTQGQTVYYTTATIQPGAGASATAYLILAGLPSGTYSVTIFSVTPSGVVISTNSQATATI